MKLKQIFCIALAILMLCLTACATEPKRPSGVREFSYGYNDTGKTYYAIQLPEGKNVENYFELVGQTYYHSMDGGQISYKIQCGTKLPVGSRFCGKCGTTQDN